MSRVIYHTSGLLGLNLHATEYSLRARDTGNPSKFLTLGKVDPPKTMPY